ncbi:siroheme synthase CysG [uncultured Roseobacter sp.]|uniref:siroheme synthase CysG n=1 Tax=uncultured Roseobacter sp. TaxID=114847 RepID=UPI002628B20D|nr:siroheme synthase CysG [uncultured Roseobacter sp.]
MKTFPMFLQMAGRRVVIVGGGEQAAQKTRLMLKTDAQIHIVASDLDDELTALARDGRVLHQTEPITDETFQGSALVFIATGCSGADAAIQTLAKAAGSLVNVVDQPDLCDAITPSIVDRDPVVVAIGTEGTAPVLARQIKTRMEQVLEPGLGRLAALAGRLRPAAAARLAPRERRDLWRWVFAGPAREAHARGAEREAARMIKDALQTGDFATVTTGSVALVGAGPGARDLITLRGVQRLQEADVIYYDRLIDPDLLELARRDAERVYVGKAPGCHSWPQDRISSVLVSAARQGKRCVRLKCGDPGIFARGAEEITALEAAGIPFEIVPGVTAASGAAAACNAMLTERGEVDTLVLTTGHRHDGPHAPAWLTHVQPGASIALYMSVASAPMIQDLLVRSPYAAHIEVTLVSKAQSPAQKIASCHVTELADALIQNDMQDTTMILLKLRKSSCLQAGPPARGTTAAPELRAVSS